MSAKVKLSKNELVKLIEAQEAAGTDATELRSLLAEVEQGKHTVIGKTANEEEYLAEKRGQSQVERGTDLECMICHQKFDQLISGTCEGCFKEWMLSTKKRG